MPMLETNHTMRLRLRCSPGVSSSGKSTIAATLAAELNKSAAGPQTVIEQDSFFDFDSYATDTACPLKSGGGGRVWKDWESSDAVNWPDFTYRVAAEAAVKQQFVVVDGFLLLARPVTSILAPT